MKRRKSQHISEISLSPEYIIIEVFSTYVQKTKTQNNEENHYRVRFQTYKLSSATKSRTMNRNKTSYNRKLLAENEGNSLQY